MRAVNTNKTIRFLERYDLRCFSILSDIYILLRFYTGAELNKYLNSDSEDYPLAAGGRLKWI